MTWTAEKEMLFYFYHLFIVLLVGIPSIPTLFPKWWKRLDEDMRQREKPQHTTTNKHKAPPNTS